MSVLKLSPCGDDCNYCPRYLATQSGDEENLKEVAVLWRTIGWRSAETPPAEMKCNGCPSVQSCGLGIKDCIINRGIGSCGECPDYPCKRMKKIFENNIREAGICREHIPEKDRNLFQRAFWDKKKRLDVIHKNFSGNKT